MMSEDTSIIDYELYNDIIGFSKLRSNDRFYRWLFFHSSPASYRIYDENTNYCCSYLNCCSWCLEFRYKENLFCKKNTICFLCCISFIYE